MPGWDGIRTPGRLVLWTTLFAGILAAGAVSAFAEGVRDYVAERVIARPGPMLRLAMLLPLLLVLVEGVSGSPHPQVPPAPAAMRQAEAPMLVLPSDQLSDEMIMLWSTDGFPAMVNGGSGFTPARQQEVREIVTGFPDAASIRLLRDLGVRSRRGGQEHGGGHPVRGSRRRRRRGARHRTRRHRRRSDLPPLARR